MRLFLSYGHDAQLALTLRLCLTGRMICNTEGVMSKIAVTLDRKTVADIDRWVREGRYPNRSRALQCAVELLSEREKRTRLVRELAKLDPVEEKKLADEGLRGTWAEF